MKHLQVNSEICAGCHICELSCCLYHYNGAFNPRKAMIRVEVNRLPEVGTPVSEIDVPHVCMQCDPAPCAESCPAEAFVWDDDLKIFRIDQELCTACGVCVDECPYNMIKIIDERAKKCDFCGGDPYCVHYCPTGALSFS